MSDAADRDRANPHGAEASSMGIDPHVAGLLAYAFGWLSGLVIFLIEKQHRQVRFHAAQSLVLFGGLTAAGIVLSIFSVVPVIGWVIGILSLLLWPVSGVLWVVMMIQGYKLNPVKLPVVGDIAQRLAANQTASS